MLSQKVTYRICCAYDRYCLIRKGGVGKTTTVLALAAVLSADQHRHGLGIPVVLDLDPRSDATRGVGIQPGGNRYEALFGGGLNGVATDGLSQAEVRTDEGFAIVPGSPETAFLEARHFRSPAPMTSPDGAYEISAQGA
jgi:cellulose biosynthesis protein BcsQ